MSNGSWVNATTCYVPVFGIKERGKLGIAFSALFAVSIMFTLINLKKHGQQFLREDKRFRLIGRRWQWYWMLFVAACGLISTITSVDVDRDYLQDIAIVLQGFFFMLMLPGTMAMVWEAVRHWGSWQERQIVDRDPFLLRQDDRRSKIEFFLPLVFYFFAWLNFFMTIPRSWGKIELQRSPEQQRAIAEPSATDVRFKAGSIVAVLAWATIVYMLQHHLHYYKPRSSGIWSSISKFCIHCPTKLFLTIVVLAVRIAYGIASAWEWEISVLKYDANPAWFYGAGYAPSVLIIMIFNIAGYIDENDDKAIVKQRAERGRSADAELGIVKRPAWWKKRDGDHHLTDEARLRALTTEVGGGRATSQHISTNLELGNMNIPRTSSVTGPTGRTDSTAGLRDRSRSRGDPFRDPSPAVSDESDGLRPGLQHRPSSTVSGVTNTSRASGLTGRTLTESVSNVPPQRVRSMLDI